MNTTNSKHLFMKLPPPGRGYQTYQTHFTWTTKFRNLYIATTSLNCTEFHTIHWTYKNKLSGTELRMRNVHKLATSQ